MPYLRSGGKLGAVPQTHERCIDSPCVLCVAREGLTDDDWAVVRYWEMVADQVVNLTPLGIEGGGTWLAPNLASWVAAADLALIPKRDQPRLISQARYLQELISGRKTERGVFSLAEEALAPPPED